MATETWKYPTATSPTKTLTFETAGRQVTSNDFIIPNQVQDVSIGGVRMVKNIGDELYQYEYSFYVPESSTSVTDATDVLEFIGSSYANYSVNSFVWTDHNSVARTVRIISENISIQTQTPYKLFSFLLETVNT